jgi:hypothetical protein
MKHLKSVTKPAKAEANEKQFWWKNPKMIR